MQNPPLCSSTILTTGRKECLLYLFCSTNIFRLLQPCPSVGLAEPGVSGGITAYKGIGCFSPLVGAKNALFWKPEGHTDAWPISPHPFFTHGPCYGPMKKGLFEKEETISRVVIATNWNLIRLFRLVVVEWQPTPPPTPHCKKGYHFSRPQPGCH
jgi:hypothetical protein